LGNPNNPTGHLNAKAELLNLARQLAQQDGVLVVDESFLDFVPQRKEISLLGEAVRADNILVIVSLTKFFAMPGLRIGFAAGSKQILARIAAIQPSWGIATPAAAAGLHALNDFDFVVNTHRWVAEERAYLSHALGALSGIKVFPAAANFLLVDFTATGRTSAWWQEQLVRRGFLLRLCEDFDGLEGRCLRVAVRLHSDNAALVEAFKAVLAAIKR
jgi:threonine-phosphate decarboxylase